jgi:PilZ domain-containing protein
MTDLPEDQEQAPRRAYSRLRLGISAQLETLDGRQRVRLIDLSQGGAHVILSQPGDVRQAVLTWLHFETFGMVAWREDVNIGLKFDKLLPLAVLVETRQRAPSVVREEAMGAQEAAREWVAGTSHLGSER